MISASAFITGLVAPRVMVAVLRAASMLPSFGAAARLLAAPHAGQHLHQIEPGFAASWLRVLVIEDNIDGAESIREVLELAGHTAEVAFAGVEGLEKARSFEPDVVLCDVGLPGMDGYEVARAMRAEPALRTMRLVALTGYAGPDDIARSKEAGFDAHVAKPPSLEKLAGLGQEAA